jgi:hypothetical protein
VGLLNGASGAADAKLVREGRLPTVTTLHVWFAAVSVLRSVRGPYVEVVVGDLRPHASAAALDQEVDLMTQHASRGPSVQGTGGSGSSAFGLDVTCRGCQEGRLGI